jgi:hypothetical protein
MVKPLDAHQRVAALMEAERRRDEWFQKAVKFEKAGKIEAARKALKKADWWEFRRRKLKL